MRALITLAVATLLFTSFACEKPIKEVNAPQRDSVAANR
jgi:hypothetical protein